MIGQSSVYIYVLPSMTGQSSLCRLVSSADSKQQCVRVEQIDQWLCLNSNACPGCPLGGSVFKSSGPASSSAAAFVVTILSSELNLQLAAATVF